MVFYGEKNCEQTNCSNKAYFIYEKRHLCGVHSKKYSKQRTPLPKRPKAEILKLKNETIQKQKDEIEQARLENVRLNKHGKVSGHQMRMMKSPNYQRGFLNVFPNFKHQLRSDGFGCSSLSPMSLGPLLLNGKMLSNNLENFHQGSKCFSHECDALGEPSEVFFKNQSQFFNDSKPHRHKFKSSDKPLFFVWRDETSEKKIHKLNYFESRQFYCNFYERLASETEDFKKLKVLVENGTNVQICGYDSREIANNKQLESEYLNTKKPFGHELCLMHMLLTPTPSDYVWRKFKTFQF